MTTDAVQSYYDITLAASLLMTLIYVFMWHRHFDVHITLIFVLVPVTNLGYTMLNRAGTLEEALIANRLTYIGGCYLLLIIMFSVFSLCQIHLNRWLRVSLIALSTVVYLSALSSGRSPLFYEDVRFSIVNGTVTLTKDYGRMHAVFLAMIFGYFLMSLGAIVYSYLRKNQVSRKILLLLFLPVVVAMAAFFGGRRLFTGIENAVHVAPAHGRVPSVVQWNIEYDTIGKRPLSQPAADSSPGRGARRVAMRYNLWFLHSSLGSPSRGAVTGLCR